MILGIDIGGTKTLLAVFDKDDNIVFEKTQPTDPNYQEFRNNISQQITDIKNKHNLSAIGVAAPGVIREGVFVKGGNLQWENAAIEHDISSISGLPCAAYNDAKIGAVGEATAGAGQDFSKMVYITISTGIGVGVTVDGHLSHSLATSECGQMTVEKNNEQVIWERIASGKAFFERYLVAGSDCEDPKVWEEYSLDIARGLNPVIATIMPDAIVVGGSMGEHLHKYHDSLVEHLRLTTSKVIDLPTIVPAKNPDHAVIYGCNIVAKKLLNKAR